MPLPFADICRARLPLGALPLLASLRTEPSVKAALTERHVWLRWDAGNQRVLNIVMPIHHALLYRLHEGRWHRLGHALPDFDIVTDLDEKPLAHVLFPAPVVPLPVPTLAVQPLRFTLARDDVPRVATALLAPLSAIIAWSDTVPSVRLASLGGVCLGPTMLILGERLPLLDDAERFWGKDVLCPLGLAPVPALPESALVEAAGLGENEILLLQSGHAEVIARSLVAPLTRAGLRLTIGTLPKTTS